MVVELRRGNRCLIVNDEFMISEDGYDRLDYYNDDLTSNYIDCLDIVKVYKVSSGHKMNPKFFDSITSDEMIWERVETFDFNRALELLEEGKIVKSLESEYVYKIEDEYVKRWDNYYESWTRSFFAYREIKGQWIEVKEGDINE